MKKLTNLFLAGLLFSGAADAEKTFELNCPEDPSVSEGVFCTTSDGRKLHFSNGTPDLLCNSDVTICHPVRKSADVVPERSFPLSSPQFIEI